MESDPYPQLTARLSLAVRKTNPNQHLKLLKLPSNRTCSSISTRLDCVESFTSFNPGGLANRTWLTFFLFWWSFVLMWWLNVCQIRGVSAADCRCCTAVAFPGFDSSSSNNNNNPPLCVTLTACSCRSVCGFLAVFLFVTGTLVYPKRTKSQQSCSRPANVTHSPLAAATLGCGLVTYKSDESNF